MTDPFFHDDDRRRPAPPSTSDIANGPVYDPDGTLDRSATRPPGESSIAGPGSSGSVPAEPRPSPPGQYVAGAVPPTPSVPDPTQIAPGVPPGSLPPGPVPPGSLPPGSIPPYGGGGSGDGPNGGRSGGLLVAALVAVVLVLGGAIAFVLSQGDGDADGPQVTTGSTDAPGPTDGPEPTTPVTVDVTTVPDVVVEPTTTAAPAPGSVGSQDVAIVALAEVLDETQRVATIEELLASTDTQPISSSDEINTLCAGVFVLEPVEASAVWYRDGIEIQNSDSQRLEIAAAGHCIDGGGAPLAPGTYEVEFVDVRDNISSKEAFTVGAATVDQVIVNDSGAPICEFDVAPAVALSFSVFRFNPALDDGQETVIAVPNVELEAESYDCDGNILQTFTFTPTTDNVGMATGAVTSSIPPTTPEELAETFGRLETYDRPLSPGAEQTAAISDIAVNSDVGRIATLDRALTMCGGFIVPGTFDGEMVWEFNEAIIARLPVVDDDQGVVGSCITPGGEAFDTGSYQTYLDTPEAISRVQSFTVGRAETLLTFVNDTGAELCEIGFSPLLTRFYSPYFFFDENGDEEPLLPNETFTIPAPLAEVDIEVRDCDDNQVTESRAVAPTDQVVSVLTGLPA